MRLLQRQSYHIPQNSETYYHFGGINKGEDQNDSRNTSVDDASVVLVNSLIEKIAATEFKSPSFLPMIKRIIHIIKDKHKTCTSILHNF